MKENTLKTSPQNSLQELIGEKPHPLDTENFFKTSLFTYIEDLIPLAQNSKINTKCLYQLPKVDQAESCANSIKKVMLESEFDTKIKKLRRQPYIAIFFMYPLEIITLIFIEVSRSSLIYYSVFSSKAAVEEITSQVKNYGRVVNKNPIFLNFGIICLIYFLREVFGRIFNNTKDRVKDRFLRGLKVLSYEKSLRMKVMNSKNYDRSKIINCIQRDISRLRGTFWLVATAIDQVVKLSFFFYSGFSNFGVGFLTLIFGYALFGYLNKKFLKLAEGIAKQIRDFGDKKVKC